MTAAQRKLIRAAIDKRRRELVGKADCDNPSLTTYRKGCRCKACRTHQNEYRNQRRRRVLDGLEQVSKHGAVGYSNGCRCDYCRVCHTNYQRNLKQQRREAREALVREATT